MSRHRPHGAQHKAEGCSEVADYALDWAVTHTLQPAA